MARFHLTSLLLQHHLCQKAQINRSENRNPPGGQFDDTVAPGGQVTGRGEGLRHLAPGEVGLCDCDKHRSVRQGGHSQLDRSRVGRVGREGQHELGLLGTGRGHHWGNKLRSLIFGKSVENLPQEMFSLEMLGA